MLSSNCLFTWNELFIDNTITIEECNEYCLYFWWNSCFLICRELLDFHSPLCFFVFGFHSPDLITCTILHHFQRYELWLCNMHISLNFVHWLKYGTNLAQILVLPKSSPEWFESLLCWCLKPLPYFSVTHNDCFPRNLALFQ